MGEGGGHVTAGDGDVVVEEVGGAVGIALISNGGRVSRSAGGGEGVPKWAHRMHCCCCLVVALSGARGRDTLTKPTRTTNSTPPPPPDVELT